jgi:mannose/fructose/N-acetylgalactosamine-specific phosphotransferase system component IID
MKLGNIMNPFERSVWVLFAFIVSVILMTFIFLAERVSYGQGIKADDEMQKSIADHIDEVSREG